MKVYLVIAAMFCCMHGFSQNLEILNQDQEKVYEFKVGDKVFLFTNEAKGFRPGTISKITKDSIYLKKQGFAISEISELAVRKYAKSIEFYMLTVTEVSGFIVQTGLLLGVYVGGGTSVLFQNGDYIGIPIGCVLTYLVGSAIKNTSRDFKNAIIGRKSFYFSHYQVKVTD